MAQAKFEDFLAEDPLSRLVRDFSRKMTANLIKLSQDYYNHSRRAGLEDMPMRHGGAALASILSAAVAPLTPVHLSEVPQSLTGRQRPKRDDKASLWCHYRDADFLVDIARCGLSLDSGRKTDTVRAAWTAALAPIAKLDPKAYAWSDMCGRLSVLVIHPHSHRPAFAANWNAEQRDRLVKPVLKVLGKSLGFLSTWDLPKAMQTIDRIPGRPESGIEFCPILFVAGAYAEAAQPE